MIGRPLDPGQRHRFAKLYSEQSAPSTGRTIAALSLLVAGGIAALIWIVLRNEPGFGGAFIPMRFVYVLPSLVPVAVLPALIFMRPKVIQLGDYLGVVLAILVAVIVFELTQIWMPSLSFDWADIVASILGAGLAGLLGWLFFFRRQETGSESGPSSQN
jgi:hypothetical protein